MLVTVFVLFMTCLNFSTTLNAETLWEKFQRNKKTTTKVQTPDGKTHESTIVKDHATRGTKNDDGSYTLEGVKSIGTEKHGTFTKESESNLKGNEEGGVSWNSKEQVGNDKNPWGWNTKNSGSSRKTNDGSAWSNEKIITDLNGNKIKVQSQGRWIKNADGTSTHIVDKTTTLADGKVLKEQEQTTFKNTEEGLKWIKETNKTNPWGNSSVSETGGASLGKDGLKWKSDKEGTNAAGNKWSTSSSGEGQAGKDGATWKNKHSGQTADGKWKWNSGKNSKSVKDSDGNVNVDTKVDGDLAGTKGEKFKAWLESMKKKQKN
jgi:hypothetical protein